MVLLLAVLLTGAGKTWAVSNNDYFIRISSVSDLNDGDEIIFVNQAETYACGTTQNTNNRTPVEITTSNHSYTYSSNDKVQVFVVKKNSSGKYGFHTGSGYIYSASESDNYLKTNTTAATTAPSKTSAWSLSVDNSVFKINNVTNTSYYLQFNGTSYFSQYKNTQSSPFIYKKVDLVTSLSINAEPTKTQYEVSESLDMSGFALDADGNTVTTGYTMTIDGSKVENGDALNSAGKKTIAVSYGGKTVNQEISVGAVTGIAITTPPTKTEYEVGDSFDASGMVITASLSTGETENPNTWTKVVTNYTISPNGALAGSETYVTITYADKTVNMPITVNAIHVTNVTLNEPALFLVWGSTDETLKPTISPEDASDKSVEWISSNENVATVDDNGVVTAVAVGTATITVKTKDSGLTASCTVTVTPNATKPSLTEVVFEDYIKNAPTSSNTQINTERFDNEGWTVNGTVLGSPEGVIRLASSNNTGSVTTPALNISSTASLSFKARGWSDSENKIVISGTNCDVTPTSFNDLSSSSFTEKNVTITVTGEKPTITFSSDGYSRFYLDDIVITQSRTTADVKLSSTGYASYCSPFALDLTPTEDYAAWTVKSTSGTTVEFTKIPGKVAANTPFILYNANKGGETVNLPIIEDDDTEIAAVSDNMLRGTLSPTYVATVDGDCTLFGLSKGSFVKINPGTIAANKAYLPIPTADVPSAARLAIMFSDETTGISETVQPTQHSDGTVYDLQGRKVGSLQGSVKGLYIVNGKKVLVK